MIYLIGGAPRVGKSTIARHFAESTLARIVSTDDLENPDDPWPSVIFHSDPQKNILTPKERIESVRNEARRIVSNIGDIVDKTIHEHQAMVIEGVHLFPAYVDNFTRKFGNDTIKAVFIGSTDVEQILAGLARNTSPDNWSEDFDQAVLRQIAVFAKAFSDYLHDESKKYGLIYIERSNDFQKDIRDVMIKLG